MKKTTQNDMLAKEGTIHIIVALVITALGFWLHPIAGAVGVAGLLFTIYFFRNPKRVPDEVAGQVISPADGTVIFVGEDEERFFSKAKMKKISIFMSPFNVHVNRAPISGTVQNTHYQKGKFLAAFDERASLENEQSAVEIVGEDQKRIVFVQIAGWLARRIVTYSQPGHTLKKGEIYGVIRFGSRMDVYFPAETEITVKLKDKVQAGKTPIGNW